MTHVAEQAQTVPGAVSAALLIAGIFWFTAATNLEEGSADNVYFEPHPIACGSGTLPADRGAMPHWLRS